MTNDQLEQKFASLVRSERKITREILELICEVERRKLYLNQAYPSLFEWLVKKYGYSHGAAYRRVQSARLMMKVPLPKEKIESGELNLSNLSQVQTAVMREERRTGQKIAVEEKSSLVKIVEGKSAEETSRILLKQYPQAMVKSDSLRPVAQEHSRLMVVIEDKDAEELKVARALLSHSCHSWAEVVMWLVRDYLKRKDPMRKKPRLTRLDADSEAQCES